MKQTTTGAVCAKHQKPYFVADDGDIYNAFAFEMFEDDGYLEGHKGEAGYHINDFDIIKYFNSWTAAADYADELNDDN